jgi:hypothetical protein
LPVPGRIVQTFLVSALVQIHFASNLQNSQKKGGKKKKQVEEELE